MMEETLRLFIAIELPDEVRAVLAEAQRRLQGQGLAVRWVDVAGAHLTLKFLGATPGNRVEAIEAALQRAARLHAPLMLRTAGLGVFPRPNEPRVVWIGVEGDVARLRALHGDVERYVAPLGYPTEKRPFSPHLTLGRTVKGATRPEFTKIGTAVAAAEAPPAAMWPVGMVSLMRSELRPSGAFYTAMAHISLDTPGAAAIIPSGISPDTYPNT
ncbi:MAG TPA: RNA 2',3'-cyclic phosphodiesterase [Herpetosiphonaceae bacterium]|nr:RNA 2',3'-cyclic phosphodiesterase [Herpetosiphonaceae bacterium]